MNKTKDVTVAGRQPTIDGIKDSLRNLPYETLLLLSQFCKDEAARKMGEEMMKVKPDKNTDRAMGF